MKTLWLVEILNWKCTTKNTDFLWTKNVDHLLLIKVYSSKIKKKIIFLAEATFENANESKENIVISDTWVIEHNPRENTFNRN